MKAFIEEYGRFLVAVLLGLALAGLLYESTVQNSRLVAKIIPDERNMSLRFIKNTEVVDGRKIPRMNIVDSVTVLINPNQDMNIDFMSPTIVKSVKDSSGGKVTAANYIPLKYARQASKLRKGYLNIIGYDAVNTQVKGDYKVTYQYEDPNTGYKNLHTMIVCVRRPYIPHEYIRATGNQYIDTGVTPYGGATAVTIEYQPTDVTTRQDIIMTGGNRMKFGIFIRNGKWGYAYGNSETLTNITATTGRQSVTLDGKNRKFIVGNTSVNLTAVDNVGGAHMQIFKSGQKFGKLYEVQIYESGKIKRNLFPAYAKIENQMGLWDTETWSAFVNDGQYYPPFEYGKQIDE